LKYRLAHFTAENKAQKTVWQTLDALVFMRSDTPPSQEVSRPVKKKTEQKPESATSEYNRAYYLANRERIKARRSVYRHENRDEISRQSKAYREANKDSLKAKREANREAQNENCRRYYAANSERIKARVRKWREENSERAAATAADYRKRNPNKRRDYYLSNKDATHKRLARWQKAKAAANPSFRIQMKVLRWTSVAMQKHLAGRRVTRASRIVQLLGCEWLDFISHIEGKFLPGMTWENHGRSGWHFDHIRPLSSFDLTDEGELRMACHFTNVQPLWAADNVRKGAKIV